MIVRFTKGQDRPDTLTCVRDDGSSTWEPSKVGVRHDLIHYAVETTLGYRDAFFGMVAGGRDIADFGTKNGRKDVYTPEEGWAEHLVGLLQWPAVGGGTGLDDEALNAFQTQYGAPPVPAEQLARIRAEIGALSARWAAIPPGGTLELVFPA